MGKLESSTAPATLEKGTLHPPVNILVAGSLAVDFSCDYTPLQSSNAPDLQLYTSNPAVITQSIGGVGYNVALAAKHVGASVRLCSIVADDLCGRAALSTLQDEGLDTSGIHILKKDPHARTAQYIAVNDSRKDLMLAMADMTIMEVSADTFTDGFKPQLERHKPNWVVVDANWQPHALKKWIVAANASGARVALEPVSAAKAMRIFTRTEDSEETLREFPEHVVDITTPNTVELAAMNTAAREVGLFERSDWWHIIDSMGLSPTGSRLRLVAATSDKLVDQGIPQQSIQLLPFIPCILTKMGAQGVLMTQLLRPGDRRLTSPASAPYILSRSYGGHDAVGGVYMRLFPPVEVVRSEEIVSVNGVGDTFLGVLIAGLASGHADMEKLVEIAQRGSVMTLKSKEAVSPNLAQLRPMMGT